MHRLCPLQHVVCVRKRPFWFPPSPMVATWLVWYSVPGNTRLLDQLRLARLSDVTVSRFLKLARSVQLAPLDSLAQAGRYCNVKTSNMPVDRGFRLAAPLYVVVLDVEQSDVPGHFQFHVGCQCQQCGGVPKDIVTFTHMTRLCRSSGPSEHGLHVLQPHGTHVPGRF